MFDKKILRPENNLPQSPDHWWITRMKDFVRVDIASRRISGYTCDKEPIWISCPVVEATHWTVRGYYHPDITTGSPEPFLNFRSEFEAQTFKDWLLNSFPHLKGGPQRQPLASRTTAPDPVIS